MILPISWQILTNILPISLQIDDTIIAMPGQLRDTTKGTTICVQRGQRR
jgi:hypothetical protein